VSLAGHQINEYTPMPQSQFPSPTMMVMSPVRPESINILPSEYCLTITDITTHPPAKKIRRKDDNVTEQENPPATPRPVASGNKKQVSKNRKGMLAPLERAGTKVYAAAQRNTDTMLPPRTTRSVTTVRQAVQDRLDPLTEYEEPATPSAKSTSSRQKLPVNASSSCHR
jgi:hypothetical protein